MILKKMADQKIEIEFQCTKCEKVFKNEKTLKEHQNRKRGGRRTGCFKMAGSSGSSGNSSSLLGSYGVPSDFSEIEDSDMNTEGIDFEMGVQSVGSHSELSINQLTKIMKEKNNSVLNGKVEEEPSAQGASKVVLPSVAFVHGLATAGVDAILGHPNFRSEPGESTKGVVDNREARDAVFRSVFVNSSQEGALQKHLCVTSQCEESCTFAQRKTLFHEQQTLLALEVANKGKVLRPRWVEHAAKHLTRLQVESSAAFSKFLPYIHYFYAGSEISKYLDDLPTTSPSGFPAVPSSSQPRAVMVAPAGNGLEVSVERIEKAAKRRRRRGL